MEKQISDETTLQIINEQERNSFNFIKSLSKKDLKHLISYYKNLGDIRTASNIIKVAKNKDAVPKQYHSIKELQSEMLRQLNEQRTFQTV